MTDTHDRHQATADRLSRTGVPDLTATLGIPREAATTMVQSYTCEFSVVRSDGVPVTYPLTPYPNRNGLTIDVSIGLIFPWKAELARRQPRVGLSFCVPTAYHNPSPALVTVRGHAAVRDRDLQGNTDRYVRELITTFPGMFAGMPGPILRRLAFYLARIWVEITPLRVHWWPDGRLDTTPERWDAPDAGTRPESDPPPARLAGRRSSRFTSPHDWRPGFETALRSLGLPALTTVDDQGWPTTVPVVSSRAHAEGAILQPATGLAPTEPGPACLSFHRFEMVKGSPFQENSSFVGRLESHRDGLLFAPDRQLVSASLPNRVALMRTLFKVWRMRDRLPVEARRRRQAIPRVNVP